jgi:hypothetical protein
MKNFIPMVGHQTQFIYDAAAKPTWNWCRVMAISELGYSLEIDTEENGKIVQWWDIAERGEHLRFRPVVGFNLDWRHLNTGQHYQMITIANQHTTDPQSELTVVYKNMDTGHIEACPVMSFFENFVTFSAEDSENLINSPSLNSNGMTEAFEQ